MRFTRLRYLAESVAAALQDDYLALLDRKLSEQTYQKYVEEHTELIPREFVQNHGIHLSIVLRKLGFGADYKSDFFYLAKSSADWHAVFIELERPQAKYFKGHSNDLHPDLLKGIEQINKWRAWLSRSVNLQSFLDTTIPILRVPHAMQRNPTYPKFVLVIGRRGEYAGNDNRSSILAAQERADFKIVSYDSLAEDLAHKHPLYVGVRRNEYIDILGDEPRGRGIFNWVDPLSLLRVSKNFVANAKRDREFGRSLDGIRVRP